MGHAKVGRDVQRADGERVERGPDRGSEGSKEIRKLAGVRVPKARAGRGPGSLQKQGKGQFRRQENRTVIVPKIGTVHYQQVVSVVIWFKSCYPHHFFLPQKAHKTHIISGFPRDLAFFVFVYFCSFWVVIGRFFSTLVP